MVYVSRTYRVPMVYVSCTYHVRIVYVWRGSGVALVGTRRGEGGLFQEDLPGVLTLKREDAVGSGGRTRRGDCQPGRLPGGLGIGGAVNGWGVASAGEGVWRGRQTRRPGRARSPGSG